MHHQLSVVVIGADVSNTHVWTPRLSNSWYELLVPLITGWLIIEVFLTKPHSAPFTADESEDGGDGETTGSL